MLRSSSTWPTVITIGSSAAVIMSPVAQAAISASATSRSVTPSRLGWRRLSHAAAKTGAATSAAAAPATRSDRPRSPGSRNLSPTATISRHPDASERLSRSASSRRSVFSSSDAFPDGGRRGPRPTSERARWARDGRAAMAPARWGEGTKVLIECPHEDWDWRRQPRISEFSGPSTARLSAYVGRSGGPRR